MSRLKAGQRVKIPGLWEMFKDDPAERWRGVGTLQYFVREFRYLRLELPPSSMEWWWVSHGEGRGGGEYLITPDDILPPYQLTLPGMEGLCQS